KLRFDNTATPPGNRELRVGGDRGVEVPLCTQIVAELEISVAARLQGSGVLGLDVQRRVEVSDGPVVLAQLDQGYCSVEEHAGIVGKLPQRCVVVGARLRVFVAVVVESSAFKPSVGRAWIECEGCGKIL